MKINPRSLAASGHVVYGSISKPSVSAYSVASVRDVEHLKYKVATNSTIIRNLACLADMLGFAGCGETQSPYAGDCFAIARNPDGTYSVQAQYNSSDPYASGYWADQRLKITLSNFRVTINPSTFHYGTSVITRLTPIAYDWVYAANPSSTLSAISVELSSSHADTYAHETTVSLGESAEVGIESEAEVPLFAAGKQSTAFPFDATAGWKPTSTASTVIGTKWKYVVQVPARSKKLVTLMAHRSRAHIDYNGVARVAFDVAFHGFLRWGSNPRRPPPTNRPLVAVTFGSDRMSEIEAVFQQHGHSNQAHHAGRDWMNPYSYNHVRSAMDFFRRGITLPLSGSFTGVRGGTLFFTEGAAQPL